MKTTSSPRRMKSIPLGRPVLYKEGRGTQARGHFKFRALNPNRKRSIPPAAPAGTRAPPACPGTRLARAGGRRPALFHRRRRPPCRPHPATCRAPSALARQRRHPGPARTARRRRALRGRGVGAGPPAPLKGGLIQRGGPDTNAEETDTWTTTRLQRWRHGGGATAATGTQACRRVGRASQWGLWGLMQTR